MTNKQMAMHSVQGCSAWSCPQQLVLPDPGILSNPKFNSIELNLSGHFVPLQRLRAAHALCSDQLFGKMLNKNDYLEWLLTDTVSLSINSTAK